MIYLQTPGTSTGLRSVLGRLGDAENAPGPTEFGMRLHVMAETKDERHSWLNQAVIVASSGRVVDMMDYDAFQVL